MGPTIEVQTAWGMSLLAHANDKSLTGDLRAGGLLEPELSAFLAGAVKPGDTVIDVGANIGYFTLLLASLVGASGRVMAFEPNPEVGDVLQANVDRNGLGDRVSVRREAVAEFPGEATFYTTTAYLGNSSLNPHARPHQKAFGDEIVEIKVPTIPLDDVLDDLGPVALMKIDIEGGEYRAFRGMARACRAKNPPVVAFELNRHMVEPDWWAFVQLLTFQGRRYGATFGVPDLQGVVHPLDEAALSAENFRPAVIMRYRP